MIKLLRVFVGATALGTALALVSPLAAQQPAAPADAPTKKDPGSAFRRSMSA